MAKAATQFACTDCGYSAGRWFGKCPQCGEFGTLVEDVSGRCASDRAEGDAATGRRQGRGGRRGFRPACRSSTACSAAASCPRSLVLVGGEPGVGKSTLLLSALAAISEASAAPCSSRARSRLRR